MAVACLVLLGGCGGDDDGGADSGSASVEVTASSLGKEQFLTRANAACRKERAAILQRVGDYLQRHEDDRKPKAELYADMMRVVLVPTVEAEIEAIRELGAPAGEEEKVEEILRAQEEAVDDVTGLRDVKSVIEVERHFLPSGELASAYGLGDCSNSSELEAFAQAG